MPPEELSQAGDTCLAPPPKPLADPSAARYRLIADAAKFQAKLILDSLFDLFMGPLALFAAILQLIGGDAARTDGIFYRVLRYGRRADRWINLFGDGGDSSEQQTRTVDAHFEQIEQLVAKQHGKGGATDSMKATIDRWIDVLQRRLRR